MTLRETPIERATELPDGRDALVWVGIPSDPYIDRRELDTVALELRIGDEIAATVSTVLEPDQESEAEELVVEVVEGLSSGRVEPTAGALEPLAEQRR